MFASPTKQPDVVTVHEIFLGFLHAKSTKGEAIADLLINFLNQNNLAMNKIRVQGYDGASNMSGRHNGVQALIRNHAPDAVYMHCKAHCLNLSIVHSCKEQAVHEIAFAFDYSAKRLESFSTEPGGKSEAREAMDKKTKLKKLCETRWFSRSDALTTFKRAFPVVVEALAHLQDNNDDKAGMFQAAILRFEFILCLVVCQHILNCVVHLSYFLQDKSYDMLEAIEECKVVITQLERERQDDAVWNTPIDEARSIASEYDIEPSFPRRAERQQHSGVMCVPIMLRTIGVEPCITLFWIIC